MWFSIASGFRWGDFFWHTLSQPRQDRRRASRPACGNSALFTDGHGLATGRRGVWRQGISASHHGSRTMNAWRHAAPLLAIGILAADGCGFGGVGANDSLPTAAPAGGAGFGASGSPSSSSGGSSSSSGGSGAGNVALP